MSTTGGHDKTTDFEWDKSADFENETKPPILKWDKTADFEVGQNRQFFCQKTADFSFAHFYIPINKIARWKWMKTNFINLKASNW